MASADVAQRIRGRWILKSFQWGEQFVLGEGQGVLLYGDDGFMMAQLWSKPEERSKEDRMAQIMKCVAYCGRYERVGDNVVHHVLGSTLLDWIGQDLVRMAAFDGEYLVLSAELMGKKIIIKWRRPSSEE